MTDEVRRPVSLDQERENSERHVWNKLGRGNKRPIIEFPEPLFCDWQDTDDFAQALDLQMRRHGDSARHLRNAVSKPGETFNAKTIQFWRSGQKQPNSTVGFDMLGRFERRYRLPAGYFRAKLKFTKRSSKAALPKEYTREELRRIRWHLPDDFSERSSLEKAEILNWIDANILSTTDYRKYHAITTKQRFGLRFDAAAPGRGSAPLLATNQLRREMADLIAFKTSTLTAIGLKRNGVWNAETVAQKVEHFGLLFGALSASSDGEVKGAGVSANVLSFGMLAYPAVWDWYLQWRERKRGFYTRWELDMLSVIQALTRPETGWMWQNEELADHLQLIEGLISSQDVENGRISWRTVCEKMHAHASHRYAEIERVVRVHRDPFEPIIVVLQSENPLAEYRKITDEILKCMPDKQRYPLEAAETIRSFLMLRLGLHLGLRQKNLRQLLFKRRGETPSTERILQNARRGELRWSERSNSWEVFIPANAFKNSGSSYFSSNPFKLNLPDVASLYGVIEQYIDVHRPKLLKSCSDPHTFFVKTMTSRSHTAEYSQSAFYEAWRYTVERYGIFNPYTGRGAIPGLLGHGPHNVRDILATHILKQTGSYEQASYAIQDTPEMVKNHYGRFLPQDKAALAAKILNEVWI